MSAYVCGKETIKRVADAVRAGGGSFFERFDLLTPKGRDELANALLEMNVDAVNQRYGEKGKAEMLDFEKVEAGRQTRVETLKTLSCYLYQCREGDVPERPLFRELERLRGNLAAEIVMNTHEYFVAAWE